uniref:Uncharacterized protein n=1 Tax=Rhizophora mucronata TaxID=61149 RepID=A0A2P2NW11_RHIMU
MQAKNKLSTAMVKLGIWDLHLYQLTEALLPSVYYNSEDMLSLQLGGL